MRISPEDLVSVKRKRNNNISSVCTNIVIKIFFSVLRELVRREIIYVYLFVSLFDSIDFKRYSWS